MGNIYNTPEEFDKSDPENIRIQTLFPDKETSNIKFKETSFRTEIILRLYLNELLEDATNYYLNEKPATSRLSEEKLSVILKSFCEKLQVLMNHNESQNHLFVQSLSMLWHNIIEHVNDADLLMQPPQHIDSLKTILKQIFQFPKNNDHSFGYYLNEYAGEKWLPFPFMDLLNSLHKDAMKNKSNSTLFDWHRSLNLILEPLDGSD